MLTSKSLMMLILTKFCFRFQNVQSTSQKYHPRRESFLHNQRASLPLKQKQIDSDSGLVDKHKIFMILLWKLEIICFILSVKMTLTLSRL